MGVNINKRIELIEDLPSMPHTLQKILDNLDGLSTNAESLELLIRDDPVLSANILRVANSPYYGVSGEVSSLSRAVVVMGFEEVKNLVIGLSLTGTFSGDLGVEIFDAKQLWLHSIGVARASQSMSEQIPDFDADELFTAGLMHDLGKFLLCLYFSDEFHEIIQLQKDKGVSLFQAEEEYGLTHAEAGAFLAQKWGMSDMLVNVVRYHHHPASAGPHSQAASVVFLADQICHKIRLGGDMGCEPEKVKIPKNTGLAPERIKAVARELRDSRSTVEEGWGSIMS